ncbi:MAG TPA: hypothetical protein VJ276_02410 [Thermoanaerobaculia bacterium]|nr:hypothetical protein [Thermoanaerobaculia bacterium]
MHRPLALLIVLPLLGTTGGVDALDEPSHGYPSFSSTVQAVVTFGASSGEAADYVTADDPPFLIIADGETPLYGALLAAGVRVTLNGDVDAFLDAILKAPARRRSAGRP